MPSGKNDFTLTIGIDGTAESGDQFADYIHNFATKCDADAGYSLEFVDIDGFGVAPFPSNLGPIAYPVNRKVHSFRVRIFNGTPGKVILFRVGVD